MKNQPVKLTKQLVQTLPIPATGQVFYRDVSPKGFGLKISSGGGRSFFVERRIKGQKSPKRIKIGNYPDLSLEEAKKIAEVMIGQIAKGLNVVDEMAKTELGGITLEAALRDYLFERDLKPRTREDCEVVLKRNVKAWLHKPLQDISTTDVLTKFNDLKKRSPAQANLTMRYLRSVYNYASARYRMPDGKAFLPANPVKILTESKSWAKVGRRRTVLKPTELKPWHEALSALHNTSVADYMFFLLLSGLRKTEALTMTWKEVDFKEETITITDTKARRPHTLPLSEYMLNILQRRKEACPKGCEWVWYNQQGGKISNFRYVQKEILKKSGVDFCLHDLRRTFSTIAESVAVPHYALKKLLNHSTESDVTAGYLVVTPERLKREIFKVTSEILRLCGIQEVRTLKFDDSPQIQYRLE